VRKHLASAARRFLLWRVRRYLEREHMRLPDIWLLPAYYLTLVRVIHDSSTLQWNINRKKALRDAWLICGGKVNE
jgi:hypothetical protein